MHPLKAPTLRPRHTKHFRSTSEPEEVLPFNRFRCSPRRVHMVLKSGEGVQPVAAPFTSSSVEGGWPGPRGTAMSWRGA